MLLIGFLGLPFSASAQPYSAPIWLPNGHIQTIYSALTASPDMTYYRQRWELPDGDFIDVDWTEPPQQKNDQRPIVALFHGLEGDSQSGYAKSLMALTKSIGWRGVVIHFRGCSGEPNRLPRTYYAGDTYEIEWMLSHLQSLSPDSNLYAVGVSLGGNALLKWLGETGDHANTIVKKAIAVSAPMDLSACANALDTGLNRLLYTPTFVDSMRPKAIAMAKKFPGLLDENKIHAAKTIHDIDNAVTSKLYGASSAEAYYAKNASKPWLGKITLPTLILNAKNDPFIPESSLPNQEEVSPFVTLEYPDSGGHAGFPSQSNWLATHLLEYFQSQ
ncbi:MAG: YheT family hydrolase [Methylophilus sp.]